MALALSHLSRPKDVVSDINANNIGRKSDDTMAPEHSKVKNPPKRELVKRYMEAMKIEECGGTTVHLGPDKWILSSSSGGHVDHPTMAMRFWLDRAFGVKKANILVNVLNDMGHGADVDAVKLVYNARLKAIEDFEEKSKNWWLRREVEDSGIVLSPIKRDAGIALEARDPAEEVASDGDLSTAASSIFESTALGELESNLSR